MQYRQAVYLPDVPRRRHVAADHCGCDHGFYVSGPGLCDVAPV